MSLFAMIRRFVKTHATRIRGRYGFDGDGRFVRRVGGSSNLVKTAGNLQLPTIMLSSLSLPNP